ncbi:MAG: glycosyltransferase family 4 protein [Anaerolineales bacterium]|nr:glycosyltransferase family 4 protein [Anaerolineales bacterium]
MQIVHQYPPQYVGGTELYTQSLAQQWAARGHASHVLSRRSQEGSGCEKRLEGDVTVWEAWNGPATPARRFMATFGAVALSDAAERVLDEIAPDLIHVEHLMGWPVALLKAIRARNIPFVVTLHDYWWICANAQLLTNYNSQICSGPEAYVNCARCALARSGVPHLWPAVPPLSGVLAWRRRLLREVLLAARSIIAPSHFVRTWYTAQEPALSDKIQVIPHGIAYAGTRSKGSVSSPVRFVYLGGLSWQKGVHVVVEAFQGLDGEAELWIAGDESFDPEYARLLHDKATPAVRFLGPLAHERIWEVLSQADALVVPSLWYETFSLVTREAFAAGVPAIVSDLGALAEAVQDGVDGLRVPPGDVAAWRAALQRLIREPELRVHLREGVRMPLTLSEHVDHMERLYLQCVDSKVSA